MELFTFIFKYFVLGIIHIRTVNVIVLQKVALPFKCFTRSFIMFFPKFSWNNAFVCSIMAICISLDRLVCSFQPCLSDCCIIVSYSAFRFTSSFVEIV